MKLLVTTAMALALSGPAFAQDNRRSHVPVPTLEELRAVAPALERFTQSPLIGEVWNRPGLSRRDRSIVTLSILIARNQTIEMPFHIDFALENGVKPAEISEIITHLAFYSGWPNAMAAVVAARDVFTRRGISADQVAANQPELLPLDAPAEAARAARVHQDAGSVSPALEHYTTNPLFLELWQRPALAPRDRSLVTVSSLLANGQAAQAGFHLGKAMDNGLTREEAGEMIAHLAFYAGWPVAFSAVPVARQVFERRPN